MPTLNSLSSPHDTQTPDKIVGGVIKIQNDYQIENKMSAITK